MPVIIKNNDFRLPRKKRVRKYRSWFSRRKISSAEITVLSRQLATLLAAGISVVQALTLLQSGQAKLELRSLLAALKANIEDGNTVAETLRQYPQYFNALFCNLIAVGEQAGALDHMFERVATHKEKMAALTQKIMKALLYPAVVVLVAIMVTVAMLVCVIPQFATLFAGFGAALPLATRRVIAVAYFVQNDGAWAAGLLLLLIIIGYWRIRCSARMADRWARVLLKLPISGRILGKAIIARITRTLATTCAAGLPLVDALATVAGITGNRLYTQATYKVRDQVITGKTFHQALRETNLFPAMVVQMMAIGEESGALEAMLNKVASIYENEVDSAVDNLGNLLEPVIMSILGVVIGGLVVAMYLPIFKLGGVV